MFLSVLYELLGPSSPEWKKVLVMEVLKGICMDFHLLQSLFHLDPSHIYDDLLVALGKVSATKPHLIGFGKYAPSSPAVDQDFVGLSVTASVLKVPWYSDLFHVVYT